MTRRTILTFVSAYLPGYRAGGPIRSIANLVDYLGDEFDFRIVTADRDRGAKIPYQDLDPDLWHEVGKARVRYLPPSQQRLLPILRVMRATPHDLIYLNSFLNPRFATLPLVVQRLKLVPTRPVILAPRGEFSEAALAIKSSKKRVFLAVSRAVGLHRGLVWQATSNHEAAQIRQVIGNVAKIVRIAPDLPKLAGTAPSRRVRNPLDPLRIVFLGRVVPMKNLLFALDVLAGVKTPIEFSIYGPREDATYSVRCDAAVASLPCHVKVVWGGPLPPDRVVGTLAQHDLFFLPSLGENFGHVIAEALQAGLRLLISDRTPWRGLDAAGVGYDLPIDSTDNFVRAIEDEARIIPSSSSADAIQAFFAEASRLNERVAANRRLFEAIPPK